MTTPWKTGYAYDANGVTIGFVNARTATWDANGWVEGQPNLTSQIAAAREKVKAEAQRRILALAPEWKQRNLTAQAAILSKKGEAKWTADEQARWDAGEALWNQIKAIRDASDVIEEMNPIPGDLENDVYWP